MGNLNNLDCRSCRYFSGDRNEICVGDIDYKVQAPEKSLGGTEQKVDLNNIRSPKSNGSSYRTGRKIDTL